MILGIPSFNGRDHGNARIHNIWQTGAQVFFYESNNCARNSDGTYLAHGNEQVAFAVLENGLQENRGSGKFMTGKNSITTSHFGDFTYVRFPTPFDNAAKVVVIATPQTRNGWKFGKARVQSINRRGFFVNYEHGHPSQVMNGQHPAEDIAWIATDLSTFVYAGRTFDFSRIGMRNPNHARFHHESYGGPLVNPGAFGQIMSKNGHDPANLRAELLTITGSKLYMHEDQCGSGDWNHVHETVGLMTISGGDGYDLVLGGNGAKTCPAGFVSLSFEQCEVLYLANQNVVGNRKLTRWQGVINNRHAPYGCLTLNGTFIYWNANTQSGSGVADRYPLCKQAPAATSSGTGRRKL